MNRRDRVGSGSTVSSVVSSFTRKSQQAAKENIPSRLPRGPTTPKDLLNRTKSGESVKAKDTTGGGGGRPSQEERASIRNGGSTGSRSEVSSVSSRRESTASSVSSEPPASPVFSPQVASPVATEQPSLTKTETGRVTSPKVILAAQVFLASSR